MAFVPILIGGTVLAGMLLLRKPKRRTQQSGAALPDATLVSEGTSKLSDGSTGSWRVLSSRGGGYLGQFRLPPTIPGFGAGQWLDVPQGVAPDATKARLLALEQLAAHDPQTGTALVGIQDFETPSGARWRASVNRLPAGNYQGAVAPADNPEGFLKAIGRPTLQPSAAMNLALEYLATLP